MTIEADLSITAPGWAAPAALQALVDRALEASLAETGPVLAGPAEVSCLFCDDATIRALNAQWRGIDKPTNVLSFPAPAPGGGPGPLLGDIVLAYETVTREAAADGKTMEAHISHLVVHGFLHLLGHDHLVEDEAETMERLESRILHRLGYSDPYAEAPEGGSP